MQWQRDGEGAAAAEVAGSADIPAHQPRQTAADSQAQSGPLVAPAQSEVNLTERLEQQWQVPGLDPDAGVGHLHTNCSAR